MAKTTLTVELTEDLAREFKAFCKEQCTDVQDALAMLVMGSLYDPELFDVITSESVNKESEDMERNPDDYEHYTSVEELDAEWEAEVAAGLAEQAEERATSMSLDSPEGRAFLDNWYQIETTVQLAEAIDKLPELAAHVCEYDNKKAVKIVLPDGQEAILCSEANWGGWIDTVALMERPRRAVWVRKKGQKAVSITTMEKDEPKAANG